MKVGEWLAYIESIHPTAIDMGLDRLRAVGANLGLISHWSCPVITVAGTNGKGTTVKSLSTLFNTLGYKVGTYTSPHLIDFSERIEINLSPASESQLVEAFAQVEQARVTLGQTLTYFEFTTLAALLIFKAQPLDVLILEIGLGGRLDAVNMIDPDVSIITTIGLDHQDYLGNTLDKIAQEKAGIIRENKPVIIGEGACRASLLAIAKQKQAKVYVRGKDFNDRPIFGKGQWVNHLFPESVQLAIQALTILANKMGISLDKIQKICDDFPLVHLMGRFQQGLFKQQEWVLDVAHNAHAANWLAEQLNTLPPVPRTHFVWCSFADKDLEAILLNFLNKLSKEQQLSGYWHIGVLNHVRSATKTKLETLNAAYLAEHSAHSQVLKTFEQALNQAYNQAMPGDRVVVFGSFQAVNEALAFMKKGEN